MNRSDFLATVTEKAESAERGRHWKSGRGAKSDLRVSPGDSAVSTRSRVLAREITKGRGYNKGRGGREAKGRKNEFITETQPAGTGKI